MAFAPVRTQDHPQSKFDQQRDAEPSFISDHSLNNERLTERERRKDAEE